VSNWRRRLVRRQHRIYGNFTLHERCFPFYSRGGPNPPGCPKLGSVCHDLILKHNTALFDVSTERWWDFNPKFVVLLYELTSRYFESDVILPKTSERVS